MKWLKGVAREQGVSIGDVQLDFDQVISGTGPSAFTKAIIEEMNKGHKGPRITWYTFHDMDESKVGRPGARPGCGSLLRRTRPLRLGKPWLPRRACHAPF